MQPPDAAQLLDVWERGWSRPPERALLLLALACPDTPAAELARLSVGQRDARLLELRERAFGPRLVALAACPGCGERVEAAFTAADVPPPAADLPPEGLALDAGDWRVRFRLPDSLDLLAVAALADEGAARRVLLERCVESARRGEEAGAAAELPDAVAEAVAARMAEVDPLADVRLALNCPACGRPWEVAFDVVAFFWSELDAWARRTFAEVHALASAYGWREADVLALSPERRRIYLDMVQG